MNRHLRRNLLSLTAAAVAAAGTLCVSPAASARVTSVAPSAGIAAIGVTSSTRIGMSTPRSEWSSRLAQVGGVDARRLFGNLDNADGTVTAARAEIVAGRLPIISFKVPGNDWLGAAAGKYDPVLRSLTSKLAALRGQLFVTLHHEPNRDGTPAAYAAMQRHVLPILRGPANVDAGVILNGFWWSAKAQGLTDAELAQWLPADVRRLAEVVAADTYQAGTTAAPGEDASVKIRRMSAWATRTGVSRLGVGEYNGLTASAVGAAGDAVLADRRFVFASCFNSSVNNAPGIDWTLTGNRLEAFKATVAKSRVIRVQ